MDYLNKKDLIIIKESQGWASKSISKLRSLTDKRHGAYLRDLLEKSTLLRDRCGDVWDDLVTSGSTEVPRTINDRKAFDDFRGIKILLDNIKYVVINVVAPSLLKEKVDIKGHYVQQARAEKEAGEKEREAASPASPAKKTAEDQPSEAEGLERMKEIFKNEVDVLLTEVSAGGVPESMQKNNATLQKRLNEILGHIQSSAVDTTSKAMGLMGLVRSLISKYKEDLYAVAEASKTTATVTSIKYQNLIKNAATVEVATYYYMLSLAGYGTIKTPTKEVLTSVKQFIPFIREPSDIYSLRTNVIAASKDLYSSATEFARAIQSAIKTEDKLSKWIMLIEKHDEFVDIYNSKIPFFVSLYDALAYKAKHDKLLKSRKKIKDKKDKKDIGTDYSLGDFSSYDWSDVYGSGSSRFREAEKIKNKWRT